MRLSLGAAFLALSLATTSFAAGDETNSLAKRNADGTYVHLTVGHLDHDTGITVETTTDSGEAVTLRIDYDADGDDEITLPQRGSSSESSPSIGAGSSSSGSSPGSSSSGSTGSGSSSGPSNSGSSGSSGSGSSSSSSSPGSDYYNAGPSSSSSGSTTTTVINNNNNNNYYGGSGSGTSTGSNPTVSSFVPSGTLPNVPAATLLPCAHPNVNISAPGNLVPGAGLQIWYQQNFTTINEINNYVNATPAYGQVTLPQAIYPVVILDHTDLVTNITCTSTVCTFTFANLEALALSANEWQAAITASKAVLLVATNVNFIEGASGRVLVDRAYIELTSVTLDTPHRAIIGAYDLLDFAAIIPAGTNVTIDVGHGGAGNNGSLPTNGTTPGTEFDTDPPGTNTTTPSTPGGGPVIPGTNTTIPGTNTTIPGTNSTLPGPAPNTTAPACFADEDFDVCLDRLIGFMDPNNLNYDQLLPGVNYTDEATGERRRFIKRDLQKRWGFISAITSGIKIITNIVKTAGAPALQAVANAANSVGLDGNALKKSITDSLSKIDPSSPKDFHPWQYTANVDISSKSNVTTLDVFKLETETVAPTANLLYHYEGASTNGNSKGQVDVYCVDCGVKGKITAQVSAKGDMHAGFGLGIIAAIEYTSPKTEKNLAQIPLAPISIPKIINIGPVLNLAAGAEMALKATGSIMAGVALDWPAINAVIDVVDTSKTSFTGFSPTFTPKFKASAALEASASVYALISIEVSIDLLSGTFQRGAGLYDKPALTISAAASADSETGVGTTDDGCKGVGVKITLNNELYWGLKVTEEEQKTPIANPSWDLYKTCLPLGDQTGTTPATPTTGDGATTPSTGDGNTTPTTGDGNTKPTTGEDGEGSTGTTPSTGSDDSGSGSEDTSSGSEDTEGTEANERRRLARRAAQESIEGPRFEVIRRSSHPSLVGRSIHSGFVNHAAKLARRAAANETEAANADEGVATTTAAGETSPQDDAPPGSSTSSADENATSSVASSEEADPEEEESTAGGEAIITTPEGDISLRWGDNGNVYPYLDGSDDDGVIPDIIFQADEEAVWGDLDGNVLIAYVDTLANHNVSRVRFANPDTNMPKTAVLVSFYGVDFQTSGNNRTNEAVLGFTSSKTSDFLYPLICAYADKSLPAKVFLAKDPEEGAATLLRTDLQASITGGQVAACDFFQLNIVGLD